MMTNVSVDNWRSPDCVDQCSSISAKALLPATMGSTVLIYNFLILIFYFDIFVFYFIFYLLFSIFTLFIFLNILFF